MVIALLGTCLMAPLFNGASLICLIIRDFSVINCLLCAGLFYGEDRQIRQTEPDSRKYYIVWIVNTFGGMAVLFAVKLGTTTRIEGVALAPRQACFTRQ